MHACMQLENHSWETDAHTPQASWVQVHNTSSKILGFGHLQDSTFEGSDYLYINMSQTQYAMHVVWIEILKNMKSANIHMEINIKQVTKSVVLLVFV